MQAIEIPIALQKDITIDFITRLPGSTDLATEVKYNAILVIIDRFIKYAKIIPYKKEYTVDQLDYLILNRLIRHHSILKTIISDRDKLFISNYQTTLIALIKIKQKLLTAYHPQTDG